MRYDFFYIKGVYEFGIESSLVFLMKLFSMFAESIEIR